MQLFSRFLWLALALGAWIVPAWVQGKPAAPSQALPATTPATSPASFVLDAGDVISLTVVGVPELSAKALSISSTGRVVLPLVGPLTIGGKTLEQARHAIETAYKSQLRRPKISIALVRTAARQATVLGAVARPGAVNLQAGWRVSQVLAAAGGLNGLAPDEVTATLTRLGAPPIALDLAAIYRAPASKANLRVAVGDVIRVTPISLVNVTINGDVGAPGALTFRKPPRLLDALERAGNLKAAPDATNISLLRDGKIIGLDVAAAAEAPQSASNLELRDGDLLSVQSVRMSVNVISDENLVKAPGNYQLEGRSNFTGALEAAGGTTALSNQIVATVRRGNQITPVDLARALYDRAADIELQNNDIVVLQPVAGPRVRVMGEIKAPELYRFPAGIKVLEALERAGGLNLAPAATRIAVVRTLPDGRQLPLQVDAANLLGGNDPSQNLELKDGDIILAQAIATPSVAVIGEVNAPGTYPLKPGDGVTQMLASAGGANQLADLGRVSVERSGQTSQIADFSQLGAGAAPDIALQDGDIMRISRNPRQILLVDAVARPGLYALPADKTLTLGEAIERAGGLASGARTGEITLLRRVPTTPQGTEIARFNYDASGSKTLDFALQAGDVVVVPAGKGASKIAQGIEALNAFESANGFNF